MPWASSVSGAVAMNPANGVDATPNLSRTFEQAATPVPRKPKRRRAASFSLRLTPEECTRLERDAGDTPLATYIKLRLFNGLPELNTVRGSGKRPKTDTVLIARLRAALGEVRLTNNLNQLAKQANMGSLEVGRRPRWLGAVFTLNLIGGFIISNSLSSSLSLPPDLPTARRGRRLI